MRILISAGEPSGDLHASNLIHALRARAADTDFIGFGGERMAQASCRLLSPLANLSLMWFNAYRHYFDLRRLVEHATKLFRNQAVQAVVLIDFPGFNWHLAQRAHDSGIPVFYFVPPQLWAWGAWRVRKMRRWADHVLCTLPFEQQWFSRRCVNAHYVGHPYFDALHNSVLDGQFVSGQRARPERIIALLPGSRRVELEYNLATFLRAARIVRQQQPHTRFLAAALNPEFRKQILEHPLARDLPLEAHVGRTAEILHVADACISVSGSVGLELLFHGVPSVVSYRVHKLGWLMSRLLKKVPWISLVNLLAGKQLLPEFLSARCEAPGIAARLTGWLVNPAEAMTVRTELQQLRERCALPGACGRAADYILAHMPKSVSVLQARIRVADDTNARPAPRLAPLVAESGGQ